MVRGVNNGSYRKHLSVCLGCNLGLELAGADAIGTGKDGVLFAMLFAPLDGTLEAGVALVGTGDEDVEIYFLHDLVDVGVGDDLIDIADRLDHVLAVFGRIEYLGSWLVLEDEVTVLCCHDQVIAQAFGTAVELYVTFMEQVIDTNGEYLLIFAWLHAGQLEVLWQSDAMLLTTGLEFLEV